MIRIRPAMTPEQYLASVAAVQKAKAKKPARPWLAGAISGTVTFALMVVSFAYPPSQPVIFTFIACVALACYFLPRYAKRQYRGRLLKLFEVEQKRFNGHPMEIDEAGIRGQCSGEHWLNTYSYGWPAFFRRLDLPDAYLFLYTPNCYIRVPIDCLTESECASLLLWSRQVTPGEAK